VRVFVTFYRPRTNGLIFPDFAMRARFLPTAREVNWLISIGFLALGCAFYLRYFGIENTPLGLACDAGLGTSLCVMRKAAYTLAAHLVFGWIALGAALVNLMRPSPVCFSIALAATAFGLVLYNAGLAGVAAGILIMSFARPAAEPELG
jgi:hypothetical protein